MGMQRQIVNEQSLLIAVRKKVLRLDYSGALQSHHGQSWFGVAIAYRMLQAAAESLSRQTLWNRDDLRVTSGHPGDGVRDAIEYVTHCVSRGRYHLHNHTALQGCSRAMKFEWDIHDGQRTASIRLRDDFVPELLFELLDRRGSAQERPDDAESLAKLKQDLADQVWSESLSSLFQVELFPLEKARHA